MSQMRRGAKPTAQSEEDDSSPTEAPTTPLPKSKRGKKKD